VLNSKETLEFFGLQPHVAEDIFNSWLRFQQTPGELGYEGDSISFTVYYVKSIARIIEDAWLPTHDWRRALAELGINRQLTDAIIDSNFDEVRKSRSASAWVIDTFRTSWEFLQGLDKRVRRKKDEQNGLVAPSPSTAPRPAIDGRTMLHKGGAMTRLASVFREDGSLHISRLFSPPPTDFHRERSDLLSFTELDIAKQYASFCQLRVPAEEGGVLTFAIPNELLGNFKEIEGQDWQQLLWWARRRPESLDEIDPPASLAGYLEAPLLIGVICGTATDKIDQLQSSCELSGQYMKTRTDDTNASQYVFQSRALQGHIQNQCAGWVWIRSSQ